MTNDELTTLLEGLDLRAEAQLAVALPGLPPLGMTITGAVTGKSLQLSPHCATPNSVWLLSGMVTHPIPPWWWLPCYRHRS